MRKLRLRGVKWGLSKVTDILSGRSDILLMEALTFNLLYVMWIGLLNPGFMLLKDKYLLSS